MSRGKEKCLPLVCNLRLAPCLGLALAPFLTTYLGGLSGDPFPQQGPPVVPLPYTVSHLPTDCV